MTTPDNYRIKPQHRERSALVYIRQSSPGQVRENIESAYVQLGLRKVAIELGWQDPKVIRDDMGISAGGFADRPGFQKMLTEITMRSVGIIFAVEASRLSRNSRDWAQLFELCGFFDTLVGDLDQIYDLSVPNDRLVLGIKGTIAEMELSVIKNRLRTGAESKAARGELKFLLPPGYSHDPSGRMVLDPDIRIREAVQNMFDQFDRFTSVRQLSLWYGDTRTLFPVIRGRGTRIVSWEFPPASTLYRLLEHPIYAGVYVYGRRNIQVKYIEGRIVKRLGAALPPEQSRVFIRDHHVGYITWERYQANQARLAEAGPRWKMQENKGAVRKGVALLAGILRCGHCGRKIYVAYNKKNALYHCDGGRSRNSARCQSFGSYLIDQRVGEELCRALGPLALDASTAAVERRKTEQEQVVRQAELRVEAAQYEADRAFEQFDHVDPKNRLVADTLEQRLNARLVELQEAETALAESKSNIRSITDEERRKVEQLGRDFPTLWSHPKAPISMKKQLIRSAIEEVIVKHDVEQSKLNVVIHWKGGAHTQIFVPKRATPVGSKADESLVNLVKELSATLEDGEIARVLNMKKLSSPKGLPWTQDRVKMFRKHHHIRCGKPADTSEMMSGNQAMAYLGISRHGLEALIRAGVVTKRQVTDFAPWMISRSELDSEAVQEVVRVLKTTGRVPTKGGCSEDQTSLFPMISGKVERDAL